MAIKRPDIYEHNNPDLSIVDADNVRGATKVVANQAAMLATPIDKLKAGSKVRYLDNGTYVEWELINISNPSIIGNWRQLQDANKLIDVANLAPALKATVVNPSSVAITIDWTLSIKNRIDLNHNTVMEFTNYENYEEVKIQCLELTFVGNVARSISWVNGGIDLTPLEYNPIDVTKRNFISVRYLGTFNTVPQFQIENFSIAK